MRLSTNVLGIFVCLLALGLQAQEFRATLQGTIMDPSRATVPKASVTLKNVETGIERKLDADDAGHYLFQFVPPGNYSVTVVAAGFKTTVRENVALSLNDSIRLDIEISLGATAETVSVVGDVAVVQADSSSLGSVVNREIIDNLPLKGHSSLYMYNLATGWWASAIWKTCGPATPGRTFCLPPTARRSPPATFPWMAWPTP